MRQRTAKASVVAATLCLITGAGAVMGTMGTFADAPARAAGDTAASVHSDQAPVGPAVAVVPTRSGSAPAPAAKSGGAAATGGGVTGEASAGTGSSGAAPAPAVAAAAPDQPTGPPSTSPPAVTPSTVAPPPASAPPSCSGSDDGLTEAQKKAREAACHAGHGDD